MGFSWGREHFNLLHPRCHISSSCILCYCTCSPLSTSNKYEIYSHSVWTLYFICFYFLIKWEYFNFFQFWRMWSNALFLKMLCICRGSNFHMYCLISLLQQRPQASPILRSEAENKCGLFAPSWGQVNLKSNLKGLPPGSHFWRSSKPPFVNLEAPILHKD